MDCKIESCIVCGPKAQGAPVRANTELFFYSVKAETNCGLLFITGMFVLYYSICVPFVFYVTKKTPIRSLRVV